MTRAVPTPVVLVVEDEMVLRMRAVDIVDDAGFVAVEAVNADEAMQILESRSDISMLFTDIQMPGSMDGLKLAHAVNKRWPHIKIVLVSGQIAVTEADKPGDSRFFPKPLEVQQMVLELQAMIGSGALKVMPALIAADDPLTLENRELRYQLQQAGIDAKALLLKTVLDTEKQQLIINENQPFQDALTTENDSLQLALEQAGIDARALAGPGGNRRRGTRRGGEIAAPDPRRTAPPHQEHARHRRRDHAPEPAHRDQHGRRQRRDRRSLRRAGAGA